MGRFLRALSGLVAAAATLGLTSTATFDPPPPPAPEPPRTSVTETTVRAGDTLEGALIRERLSRDEAREVVAALRTEISPRRIQPGDRLRIERTEEGLVLGVSYWRTPAEGHEVRRDDDRWVARTLRVPVQTRVAVVAGRLEGSLFATMERLGETPALTTRLVELFGWDFDFAAEALPTDEFRMLVEKRYVGGEFLEYGDIQIAQYRSVGRPVLTAVAFEDARGATRHYDARGRSIRKAFLRAPLDFTRITSGYSQARRHPVLGGVRPHLAVDYAAPVGTPVRAVGDGTVVHAGWRGDNGISVTLRHRRGYQTMYNHLSKATVRAGQTVRQGQVIGRVGSTGLSTGPHLDYRVVKNGRFVNPLQETFTPGTPVSPALRDQFRRTLEGRLARLAAEAPFADREETSGS